MSTTITLDGNLARQLVCQDLDGTEPYAFQARQQTDRTDHETINHLIIREQATGRLFRANYRDSVYEGSAPDPWEYDKQVTFREVLARPKVTVATEYVRADEPGTDLSEDVTANAYVTTKQTTADGDAWLDCGLCAKPLIILDSGISLTAVLTAVTGHACAEDGL